MFSTLCHSNSIKYIAPMKCPHAHFCASILARTVCEHQLALERPPAHFNAPLKCPHDSTHAISDFATSSTVRLYVSSRSETLQPTSTPLLK